MMETGSKNTPNYLEEVSELLFNGAEVDDLEYLSVVERGVNAGLDNEHRRLAYDYIDQHIKDSKTRAAAIQLVALAAVDGIHGQDSNNRMWIKEEHDSRYTEVTETIEKILESKFPETDAQIAENNLLLVLKLQNKLFSFDGQHDVLGSKKREGYPNVFARKDYYKPTSKEAEAMIELTKLAVKSLDVLKTRHPEVAARLPLPLRKLYFAEFEFVRSTDLADSIIYKSLDLYKAEHDDVNVADILALADGAKTPTAKRAALDKTLEVTAGANRNRQIAQKERIVKSRKRGWFGISREVTETVKIPEETRSVFDERLAALNEKIRYASDLSKMLKIYPDFVKKVIEMHTPEQQIELWQSYAKTIESLPFANGSYTISEVVRVREMVDRFGAIAPPDLIDQIRVNIKNRLASSTVNSRDR